MALLPDNERGNEMGIVERVAELRLCGLSVSEAVAQANQEAAYAQRIELQCKFGISSAMMDEWANANSFAVWARVEAMLHGMALAYVGIGNTEWAENAALLSGVAAKHKWRCAAKE